MTRLFTARPHVHSLVAGRVRIRRQRGAADASSCKQCHPLRLSGIVDSKFFEMRRLRQMKVGPELRLRGWLAAFSLNAKKAMRPVN